MDIAFGMGEEDNKLPLGEMGWKTPYACQPHVYVLVCYLETNNAIRVSSPGVGIQKIIINSIHSLPLGALCSVYFSQGFFWGEKLQSKKIFIKKCKEVCKCTYPYRFLRRILESMKVLTLRLHKDSSFNFLWNFVQHPFIIKICIRSWEYTEIRVLKINDKFLFLVISAQPWKLGILRIWALCLFIDIRCIIYLLQLALFMHKVRLKSTKFSVKNYSVWRSWNPVFVRYLVGTGLIRLWYIGQLKKCSAMLQINLMLNWSHWRIYKIQCRFNVKSNSEFE